MKQDDGKTTTRRVKPNSDSPNPQSSKETPRDAAERLRKNAERLQQDAQIQIDRSAQLVQAGRDVIARANKLLEQALYGDEQTKPPPDHETGEGTQELAD